MKEQIEEMAKEVCGTNNECKDCQFDKICISQNWATIFYNAGYRKQRVGRWIHNEDHNAYESEYFCSQCLADCSDIRGENYCYNCGAHMKGVDL